jgi:hypothetical protein
MREKKKRKEKDKVLKQRRLIFIGSFLLAAPSAFQMLSFSEHAQIVM